MSSYRDHVSDEIAPPETSERDKLYVVVMMVSRGVVIK